MAIRLTSPLTEVLSVIATDNLPPYSYTTVVQESSSVQVWVKASNTLTGCSGNWDSTAIANALEAPVTEKIVSANTGDFPAGYVDVECSGTEHSLYYVNGDPQATYNWNIPDLGVMFNDTMQIEVNWTVPGNDYRIELVKVASNGCSGVMRDTLVKVSKPNPDLGSDVSLCAGDSIIFAFPETYTSYEWQDHSINPSYIARTTGSCLGACCGYV